MHIEQFLVLIQASQSTLKHELLAKHPESKYQLLMLSRSFELLKHYLIQHQHYDANQLQALTDYFQLPIDNVKDGIAHLSQELRQHDQPHVLEILSKLNQLDLNIIAPKREHAD